MVNSSPLLTITEPKAKAQDHWMPVLNGHRALIPVFQLRLMMNQLITRCMPRDSIRNPPKWRELSPLLLRI